MVDALVSYQSVEVLDTPVTFVTTLEAGEIDFLTVTKRSTKPAESGTTRRYDLNFGFVTGGPQDVHNDIIPFEYNTTDFDMNNEILFEGLVDLTASTPAFFNLMPTVTSGTIHKFDMIVSTLIPFALLDCDVLVKRVLIDDLATGITNPFITQEISGVDQKVFGMASNPVFRSGQIIGYDFVLVYFPS